MTKIPKTGAKTLEAQKLLLIMGLQNYLLGGLKNYLRIRGGSKTAYVSGGAKKLLIYQGGSKSTYVSGRLKIYLCIRGAQNLLMYQGGSKSTYVSGGLKIYLSWGSIVGPPWILSPAIYQVWVQLQEVYTPT